MKRLCLTAALVATLSTGVLHAAPFDDNRPLAHPVIKGSQDSGVDIAFFKEADGVNGYYADATVAQAKARLLDRFGKAEIRSVFYAALDRDSAPEHQTMLVLLRTDGKPGLRAYRYHDSSGKYVRLNHLQPALDRIAAADGALNAARVRAAVEQLAPLDYSVVRGNSGNPDFDAIDHTAGSVIGYYTLDGKPAAAASKDAAITKKVFQKQGQRFLTATYTLFSDSGAGELPNYRLWQLTWDTAPQQFDGHPEGPSVIYSLAWDDNSVIERGQYKAGKRHGMWVRSGIHEGESKGAYVNGLPDGRWHYAGPRYSEDGVYRNGQLDGREQIYDDSGKILRRDTHWAMGKKQGLVSSYYANGKPEQLAEIERGQLVTYLREYAQDGRLVNDIRRCFFTEYDRERDDVCDYHRMYFANGKPQYDYVFQFGSRQEGRSWYPNGQVEDELLVDRAADRSVWNTYFEDGPLKCTEPRKGHSKRTVNGVAMISYGSSHRVLGCGKRYDQTGKQTSPGPEGCPPPKKPHFIFGE